MIWKWKALDHQDRYIGASLGFMHLRGKTFFIFNICVFCLLDEVCEGTLPSTNTGGINSLEKGGYWQGDHSEQNHLVLESDSLNVMFLVFIWYLWVGDRLTVPFLTGTIHEEKGISSQLWVSILRRYDLSCWKWRKNKVLHSFHPFLCLVWKGSL